MFSSFNIQCRPSPSLFELLTMSFPPFTSAKTVYVSLAGSDVGGNGTPAKPFATLHFALSQIPDNSLANPYSVQVGPGVYAPVAATLVPKRYVDICGAGMKATVLNYESADAFNGGDPVAVQWMSIRNLTLKCTAGDSYLRFTDNAASGSFAVYENLHFPERVRFGGRTNNLNGFSSHLRNVTGDAALQLQCGVYFLVGCKSQLCAVMRGQTEAGAALATTVTASACMFDNVTVDALGGGANQTLELRGCLVRTGATVNGSEAILVADAVSLAPVQITNTGGTVILDTAAGSVKYAPATPAHWNGTPPVNVSAALDRLAAVAASPP